MRTKSAILFNGWAGAALRQRAAALLQRLPEEGAELFPDIKVRRAGSTPEEWAEQLGADGKKGEESEEDTCMPAGAEAQSVLAFFLSTDVRVAPAAEPGASADAGDEKGERWAAANIAAPPMLVAAAARRLENAMLRRCGGAVLSAGENESMAAGRRRFVDNYTISAVCIVFFLWTPVATNTLVLFSCLEIEPRPWLSPLPSQFRGFWLLEDATQRCYQGPHLAYALGVGLPGARAALH